MRKSGASTLLLFIGLIALALSSLPAGCGGSRSGDNQEAGLSSSSSALEDGRGEVVFTVNWPRRSEPGGGAVSGADAWERLYFLGFVVDPASEGGRRYLFQKEEPRPASGPDGLPLTPRSTVRFTGVPAGAVRIEVSTQSNLEGDERATDHALIEMQVQEGRETTQVINFHTPVAQVRIAPTPVEVPFNQNRVFKASAYDASGALTLSPVREWQWSIADTGVAVMMPEGMPDSSSYTRWPMGVRGMQPEGVTTLTVRERQSGVSGSVELRVTNVLDIQPGGMRVTRGQLNRGALIPCNAAFNGQRVEADWAAPVGSFSPPPASADYGPHTVIYNPPPGFGTFTLTATTRTEPQRTGTGSVTVYYIDGEPWLRTWQGRGIWRRERKPLTVVEWRDAEIAITFSDWDRETDRMKIELKYRWEGGDWQVHRGTVTMLPGGQWVDHLDDGSQMVLLMSMNEFKGYLSTPYDGETRVWVDIDRMIQSR